MVKITQYHITTYLPVSTAKVHFIDKNNDYTSINTNNRVYELMHRAVEELYNSTHFRRKEKQELMGLYKLMFMCLEAIYVKELRSEQKDVISKQFIDYGHDVKRIITSSKLKEGTYTNTTKFIEEQFDEINAMMKVRNDHVLSKYQQMTVKE